MGLIYAIKARTKDDVDVEFATMDKFEGREDKKGFPAKLTFGTEPSRRCTVFYNETADGSIFANVIGPVPKKDEHGKPILTLVNGREQYEWETYLNEETGKQEWVEAPLASFSVKQGKESGKNYIFSKIYHEEALIHMARRKYEIGHIPERRDAAIQELNQLQTERGNAMLLSFFPASPIAARRLGEAFKQTFEYNEPPFKKAKAPAQSSPSPSP